MASDIERYRDIAHRASSYAAAEGLTEFGAIQAGARFGYEAGVAAERERAARIAEEFEDYLGTGYISEFTRGHDHAAAGIAAAIREGE